MKEYFFICIIAVSHLQRFAEKGSLSFSVPALVVFGAISEFGGSNPRKHSWQG